MPQCLSNWFLSLKNKCIEGAVKAVEKAATNKEKGGGGEKVVEIEVLDTG